MESYEKRIGLKTVWLTIVRRWKVILIIFVPIALASVVLTQAIMTKKYKSSFTLSNVTNLDNNGYNKVVATIQKTETINAAVEKLAAAGTQVAASDIASGISIPFWTMNTPYVTVSFTSVNKDIINPILISLSEASLDALKPTYTTMIVSSQPKNPTLASKNTTYMIIGLVGATVFGLGLAFADEIVSDEVYDSDDIRYFESPAFEITASK